MSLLQIKALNKSYGGIVATDNVSLHVEADEIHAIIGPNGAGKTTLIAQLAGDLRPDGGEIHFAGQTITRKPSHARAHLGIARSFQITSLMLEMSVLDNALLAVQAHQGHSFRFWQPARTIDVHRAQALDALTQVGLHERADDQAAALSHGEHRQLEIAMALAAKPKLMLLDEPMAGMGTEETQRMIQLLRSLRGQAAMLLVEHDMDAVFALADRVTVLVYGKVIASDTPQAIRDNESVRHAYLGDDDG